MKGPIKPGLYRLFGENNIRFFNISKSTQGHWKLREYKDGDLHNQISEEKGVSKLLWKQLQTWQ